MTARMVREIADRRNWDGQWAVSCGHWSWALMDTYLEGSEHAQNGFGGPAVVDSSVGLGLFGYLDCVLFCLLSLLLVGARKSWEMRIMDHCCMRDIRFIQ